jgi:hypothetical protein
MSSGGVPDKESAGRPPSRRGPGAPQPADLPLLYILLLVHGAVMAFLPVAVWRLVTWALGAARGALPRGLVPALLITAAAAEIWLAWRLRRTWRRVRPAPPPASPGAGGAPR